MRDGESVKRSIPVKPIDEAVKKAPPERASNLGESILALQRTAGNRAVTEYFEGPTVQRKDPPSNLATLEGYLDMFDVPEEEVIALLARMTGPEKKVVIDWYRDRLARCLDFEEMRRAVIFLGAPLPVKLEWLQRTATLGAAGISYSEIAGLVVAAPQAERDLLKNDRWKSFFLSICTNDTVVNAVKDLGFDLPTQLQWVRGEASALFSLTVDRLKPLIAGRSAADLAAVGGDEWLPFWTDVCTNETMEQLVALLFPGDLVKQIRYMVAEGTDYDLVLKRIAATEESQRAKVYDSPETASFIHGFTIPQQANIVQQLKGTPKQQLTLLQPVFPIESLTWATPSQDWVDAIQATRSNPLDMFTVAGKDLAWAPFLRSQLANFFSGTSTQVYGQDMVNLVWAAYGDGSTFKAADTLVVYKALFGRGTEPPGELLRPTGKDKQGKDTRQRYKVVDPDDAAARELMMMVKTIPRSQVAIWPITFCAQMWKEVESPAGVWTGTEGTVGAVAWSSGRIIIPVRTGGQMETDRIQTVGPGNEPSAYGAPGTMGRLGVAYTGPRQGSPGTALTYFQNNVRHEIGHAVGAKRIGTMAESGDDFAWTFGGWKTSSESAFVAAMWSPLARPASGWPSIDFGGGAVQVTDDDVRSYLVGILTNGTESGKIAAGTDDYPTKRAKIASSIWSRQRLVSYLSAVGRAKPEEAQGEAYRFPGFVPTTDPVHIYATRMGDGMYATYSLAAYNALHNSTGWYSLSSHAEMFAEIYTQKYASGTGPPIVNGKDFTIFFWELEKQDDPMFGKPPGKR